MKSKLYVNQRLVTSPFGLLGTDENALTFSLGYTFQKCLPLLRCFLRQIGISGVPHTAIRNARIELQRARSGEGITDIEIYMPGYCHVIVEAKVGLAVPSIEQCQKYLCRFDKKTKEIQRLVALVQSPDDSFVKTYAKQDPALSKRLTSFNWSEILPDCLRIVLSNSVEPESKSWAKAFYNFLDQDYKMKAFTTEVWILPVNTEPLWPNGMSFWDIHKKYMVYWDSTQPTVRPIYLAFRANGKVNAIHRVNQIEYERPIIDVVPELANVVEKEKMPNEFRSEDTSRKPATVKAEWPKLPFTIWHFDNPVNLPQPIPTGPGMYNKRVRCHLDLLLSCKSVREIQDEMSKRNNEGAVM